MLTAALAIKLFVSFCLLAISAILLSNLGELITRADSKAANFFNVSTFWLFVIAIAGIILSLYGLTWLW